MTNSVLGEIPLKLSDGREFILVADFASRVEAESAYGKPYRQVLNDAGEEFYGAIRALFYGLLKGRHPNITLQEVGTLIDEAGDDLARAANEALEAAAPKVEDKEPGKAPPRRTGKTSGRSGAKSA